MLPQNDGLSLVEKWRADKVQAHVVLLAAKDALDDKNKGLELGANDYLIKPFEFEQLLNIVRPMNGRRKQAERRITSAPSVSDQSRNDLRFQIQDLFIDTSSRSVRRGGKTLYLTPREYSLLEFLAVHRGRVVTRAMIWRHVYRDQDEKMSNVIDVYIRYLRNKVDKGFDVPLIRTRWGIGYMLGEIEAEGLVTS
jgi:DNA-binding response OmpR family regulator